MGDAILRPMARVSVGGDRPGTGGHGLKRTEIEPGAEGPPFARNYDGPEPLLGLQSFANLEQGREHGTVEGVHLVGSDHSNVGYATVDGASHSIAHGRQV